MTSKEKEISALFYLMEDPDDEVFETVANRILRYGKDIIPQLEQLWESTIDESVRVRVENLIHRACFQEVQEGLAGWAKEKDGSLLDGAFWVARYRYPDLNTDLLRSEVEQIQKNVWLELNHYLSPLEQINVINRILYDYYKIKGEDIINKLPDLFYFNHLLESKHGNSFTLGILYLTICEALDIPVFAVSLPRQFILGYFDSIYHFSTPEVHPISFVQFYIDPSDGMVYTTKDIEVYLRKINASPSDDAYIKPLRAQQVIYKMLDELSQSYELQREDIKSEEIRQLQKILEPYMD